MRLIFTAVATPLEAFRQYAGCRLLLCCSACGWSRSYDPERIIDRLRELKAGGHATPVTDVAGRVAWSCPRCRRMRWRTRFAWPEDLTQSEHRRLARRYRD